MFAVVFPGQGSQRPGMGVELGQSFLEAQRVFDEVADVTGVSVLALVSELDEEQLRRTDRAQLALFTCGVAAWKTIEGKGDVSAFAGHSVGEYAALVASGALSLADGARLIQRRGELMLQAKNGTMAAVLGLERDALELALKAAQGTVVVANDNCPGQLVISGDPEGVASGGALAQEAGAKRVLPLNVSGAFHSPLMEEAAEAFKESLASVEFANVRVPVVTNVSAQGVLSGEKLKADSEAQLRSPVRWTESMQWMLGNGVTHLVECGGGEVLLGLMKRLDKTVIGHTAQDATSVGAVRELLASEVKA